MTDKNLNSLEQQDMLACRKTLEFIDDSTILAIKDRLIGLIKEKGNYHPQTGLCNGCDVPSTCFPEKFQRLNSAHFYKKRVGIKNRKQSSYGKDDIKETMGSILEKDANEPLDNGLTNKFVASSNPIKSYDSELEELRPLLCSFIDKLLFYFDFASLSSLVISLIYLERYFKHYDRSISSIKCMKRLIYCLLVVAIKYNEDFDVDYEYYIEAAKELNIFTKHHELTKWEADILVTLEHHLFIKQMSFENCLKSLKTEHIIKGPTNYTLIDNYFSTPDNDQKPEMIRVVTKRRSEQKMASSKCAILLDSHIFEDQKGVQEYYKQSSASIESDDISSILSL